MKPEKHMYFYSLLDAFDEPGCPVCRLRESSRRQYFKNLINEAFDDKDFMMTFIDRNGLCSDHSHDLFEYKDGLSQAFACSYILRKYVSEVKADKKRKEVDCSACTFVKENEKRYIAVISDFINDSEFVAHAEHALLCIPHFEMVRKSIKKMPEWFLSRHIDGYSHMYSDLQKYIDYRNYSLEEKPEISREEALIWMDALRLTGGF
jgi:hypothetical protein